MPKQSIKRSSRPGFLYRGVYTETTLGGKNIRLVQNETYIIADLSKSSESGEVPITLKKKGMSLDIVITLKDYYQYISSGRSSFTDIDPYV